VKIFDFSVLLFEIDSKVVTQSFAKETRSYTEVVR